MSPPSPFPPGTSLVAYLRDSGGRDQDVSVERQRLELSAWAASAGLIVTHWFADEARSGSGTASRRAFLELNAYLSASRRPEAGVVIWEYARFARQFDDAMFYIADLRRQGYAVYSITDAVPDSLEGRLLESIIAWKNAKYRADLSEAVRSGFRYVISAHGGYPNRLPPLGYRKEPVQIGKRRDGSPHLTSRLVPDPATAPLVRAAFEARANGDTYAEIHNRLHLTRHHISLNRLMRNPVYIGTLRFSGQEYPGFCAPIVPAETWQAAQQVNNARSKKFGYDHPRRTRSRFLLTGILHCARCGSIMNGRVVKKPNQPDFLYYACRNSFRGKASTCRSPMLPMHELETLVIETLAATLLQPAALQPLLDQAAALPDRQAEYERRLAHLQGELDQAAASLRRIVAAIRDAGHSATLLEEMVNLERRQAELVTAMADARDHPPRPLPSHPADMQRILSLLAEKLQTPGPERLTVLRGLVVDIRAERTGGSPLKHRKGHLTGSLTLRLPILEDQEITVSL